MTPERIAEVRTDPDNEVHGALYNTLVLLAIDAKEGPVYFVVEGMSLRDRGPEEHSRYFYEQHTCPTNFIGGDVAAVYADGDRDPHGVFRVVRAIWMPQRYVDAKRVHEERGHNMGLTENDVLEDLFPELTAGHPRLCTHTLTNGVEQHLLQPGDVCANPNRVV